MGLRCNHCRSKLEPAEVLDRATCAITPKWMGFNCRNCSGGGFFAIDGSMLQIAVPDGFPAPAFEVTSQVVVPGLLVHSSTDAVHKIALGARTWLIYSHSAKPGIFRRAVRWLKCKTQRA